MYCVKCKKNTDTSNEEFTVSKNGRNMKRGTCVEQLKRSLSKHKRAVRC